MKKIISIFVSTLLIFSLFSVFAFANTDESAPMDYAAIDDGADLFSSHEEETLLLIIQDYKENYNFDITLITRSDVGNVDVLDYADDYEFVDDNSDGLVFLLNTGTREYVTSTRNLAETIFTQAAFDRVDVEVVEYLKDEDYYGAFLTHLVITGEAIVEYNNANNITANQGTEDTQSIAIEDYGYTSNNSFFSKIGETISEGLLVGVIFAAVITFFVSSYLIAEMNTARKSTDADSYIKTGSFTLSGNSDRFLFQNVSRREKPRNNTSSGGGGTRSSFNSRGSSRTSRKGGY